MEKIIIALVLCAVPLVAHSPKSVDVEFDSETRILNVAVTHSVSNASKHYVNKVIVELNGKKVIEQKFSSQTNEEEQHVLYSIHDAKEGDKIKVTAYCNISGKKNTELTVMAAEAGAGSE